VLKGSDSLSETNYEEVFLHLTIAVTLQRVCLGPSISWWSLR